MKDRDGLGKPGRERRPRWQRVTGYLCVTIAVLLTATLVGGLLEYNSLEKALPHQSIPAGDQVSTKVAHHTVVGAQDWLIMGSDTREGKGNNEYGHDIGGARSDTTILAHISRGATNATLVSIPRDSYVQIPSCVEPGGGMSQPQMNKFNAAFDIGGPGCTIKTVESLTHIAIDHFVVIDFEGFKQIVNALHGVNICLSQSIDDPVRENPDGTGEIGSGLIAHAGDNRFDGTQALAFVRSRYAVGDGSDLDRIKDQQTFISAVIRKATSLGLLLHPGQLLGVLRAAVHSLDVDKKTTLAGIADFAEKLHSLPTSKVDMLTVPLSNADATADIGGAEASVVEWDQTAATSIWNDLREDKPLPGQGSSTSTHHSSKPKSTLTVPPSAITVNVLNGTSQNGLAHTAAQQLAALGFTIGTIGDAPSQTATTTVQYGPTKVQTSQTLAASVDGGAKRQAVGSLGTSVNLIIGSDYTGVHKVTISNSSGHSPTPSASALGITTAKNNTCAVG